jgi:putative cardiolipin synthase
MLASLANDAVIEQAYRWLYHKRRHWHATADAWELRNRWQYSQLTLSFALLAIVTGCATLPEDYPKEQSFSISDTAGTSLGVSATKWVLANNGKSGFYPLQSGSDAFAARLRMLERAEVSIDAQYFLMKSDIAGHIFSQEMLLAADRGVRVRFLLDDIFSTVSDEELFILDAHEHIDVRLYNPIAKKGFFYLNFLGDFKRANRRMHNKSFTADNQITIVGGRNIADEYFDLNVDSEFEDFDVIGVGKVADDVSATFDTFWNSRRSLPLEALDIEFSSAQLEKVRVELIRDFGDAHKSIYADAMQNQEIEDLLKSKQALYPAQWEVITDDPEKLKNAIAVDQQQLMNRLNELKETADKEIIVITPYFVPLESGLSFWKDITVKGVRVVVLTNSLASTNHIAVHSGYSRYRKQLIENGIELYEARVDAVEQLATLDAPDNKTLHTKLIIIDRERVFAGSLNLDPRSIDLNAEMGIDIRSAALATELAEEFFDELPKNAYRVTLSEKGKLKWQGVVDGVEVTLHSEPSSNRWRRFKAWFLKIVPDSQL